MSAALAVSLLAPLAEAGQAPDTGAALAGRPPVTLVLAGGSGSNEIAITLNEDGGSYLIAANRPLEVVSEICVHPPEDQHDLICEAGAIGGFIFNGGPGNDVVTIGRSVQVPATLYGGPDGDLLTGGGGEDRLLGGPGDDRLRGRGGKDWIYGGLGQDRLFGGLGLDVCNGGPGQDTAIRCEEEKSLP